jgi:Ca2+-binding EF-hand superfamily protein
MISLINKLKGKHKYNPNKLYRSDYSFIARHSDQHDKDDVELLITTFMDKVPEHQLNKENFTKLYSLLSHENEIVINGIVQSMFTLFDADNNGTLNIQEFLVIYKDVNHIQMLHFKILTTFKS